jgi:hypothetical protein
MTSNNSNAIVELEKRLDSATTRICSTRAAGERQAKASAINASASPLTRNKPTYLTRDYRKAFFLCLMLAWQRTASEASDNCMHDASLVDT